MSNIEESVEVALPLRTVYDEWTQFEDLPQFMDGVQRIEQRTSTLTPWVTKVDGVEREFDAEITERISDERVAWATVAGEVHQARFDPERADVAEEAAPMTASRFSSLRKRGEPARFIREIPLPHVERSLGTPGHDPPGPKRDLGGGRK
ncbi:SRPBCC family protein [Streptomyces sp. NPDC055107]